MSEISMLNLEQERENNRDIQLKAFLLEKQKDYGAYAPFNKVVQLLFGNIDKLAPFIPVKDQKGTVITANKKDLKTTLATNVNIVCLGATEYAISIGDGELQKSVRFRTTDIKEAKDGNVAGIISTITDALTPLLDVPAFGEYQITADMLDALTKGAEDFSNTRGKAAIVDIDSSLANDALNQIFKDIRSNIASLRRLLVHFNTSNPDFVKGFNKAAAVDYTGIRHSGVVVVITDKGEVVIENATLTLTQDKTVKTATISKEGTYEIIKCAAGNWKLTIVAPGYETATATIKISRGVIQKLNFTLPSNAIELPGIHTA